MAQMKHLLALDKATGIFLTNSRENEIVAIVNGKPYNTNDFRPLGGDGRQLRADSQAAILRMLPEAKERFERYENMVANSAPAPAPAPVSAPDTALPPVKGWQVIDYNALAGALTSAIAPLISAIAPAPAPAPAIPAEISPLAKRIVTRLRAGLNVYLQGPAGCGKSFVAKQAAEILNVSYYESSAVIDIYTQLKGFVDANGVYQATAFYHAWKEGGVFLFDEIDASSPEALLDINNALASGGYTFPDAAGGYIERNPNCYIIAAANTAGNGGDGTYTARAALDKSSLDRYRSYIVVDYDREIELQLARGDTELVDFIHALRDTAKHCGFDALFTYRAISGIIAISEIDGREIAIQENIIRGMDKADVRIMSNNIGNYVDSLNTWAQVFIEMGRC